MLDEFPMWLN